MPMEPPFFCALSTCANATSRLLPFTSVFYSRRARAISAEVYPNTARILPPRYLCFSSSKNHAPLPSLKTCRCSGRVGTQTLCVLSSTTLNATFKNTTCSILKRSQTEQRVFSCQTQLFASSAKLAKTSFDIFQELSHSTSETAEKPEKNTSKKRKPSNKVLRLADDILSLTLIEAADLCDICQEALQAQSKASKSLPPGRSPFPHPAGYFAGAVTHGVMPPYGLPPPPYSPVPGAWPSPPVPPINGMSVAAAAHPLGAAESPQTAAADPAGSVAVPETKKDLKKNLTVKLVAYDFAKKIPLVREIKALLNVGLKEAKDIVDNSPGVIRENVSYDEANSWKTKLEELGATVNLDG